MNEELRNRLAEVLRKRAMAAGTGAVPPPQPQLPPVALPQPPTGGFADTVDRDIGRYSPDANASNYSLQPVYKRPK